MAEILQFTGDTIAPAAPEEVLEKAKGWGMEACFIAGFSDKGEFHFGGSTSDIAQIILMLELAKARLIEACKED